MARGTTLENLLTQYRAACRLSLNPAHNQGVREAQIDHIQRVQSDLWDGFDWPHLRVRRDYPVQQGQRYYAPPSDMLIDRVEHMEFRTDGIWRRLGTKIGAAEFAVTDSELDQQSWPVRAWQIHEGEDVEIWPITNRDADAPTLDGYLRFIGIRNLAPLVADADRADLDDKCIILYCAAEYLAGTGGKDAQFKLDKANARLAKLRGELTPTRSFNMFSTYKMANTSYAGRCYPFPFYVNYRPPGT